MKSFIAVLAVAGIAAAADYSTNATSSSASSTASAAAAAPSANIPSSISSGCKTFLTALNSASSIQSCVQPILTAVASNSSSSLSTLCSSPGCSSTTIRSWLTDFKGNCTDELITSPNKDVVATYDVLYVLVPFQSAVCAKDSTGKYCLNQLANNSTIKSASGITNAAQTPLGSDGTPDAEAFNNANILWLGANPSMSASTLCTECTKNVITSYISFETAMPPANGVANSPLLSSQTPLWNAIQKTCPADFISGALTNAGATPGQASGAATSSPAQGAALMLALVAAGVMSL